MHVAFPRFGWKRVVSWALAFLACIVVPAWVHAAMQADMSAQPQARGLACGMGALAVFVLGVGLAGVLSLLALLLGGLAYRATPSPRSRWRVLELGVIALPLVLGCAMLAMLLLA